MTAACSAALYIHVPWCIRKCPYCDFNSHEQQAQLPEAAYLAALLRDLDAELDWLGRAVSVSSVFIGGGTPSLMTAGFYRQLFDALRARLTLPQEIEITLEANPGTVDSVNFEGFRRAGINRLSIGVQSFHDDCLAALGRVHSADDAQRAFARAREAGFDNINLDLMHGLPGQSGDMAMHDLQRAVELGAEHISWYQLTIERNTEFYSRPPRLPEEDVLADIQERGLALLSAQGFVQYEVSAFARARYRSQHNLNYWRFGDYLGIGAGAHGKLSRQGDIYRRWKTRMPQSYIDNASALAGQQRLQGGELIAEFMLNALRLREGFSEAEYCQRTGLEVASIEPALERLIDQGLLERSGANIAASERGWPFLDDVVGAFLP